MSFLMISKVVRTDLREDIIDSNGALSIELRPYSLAEEENTCDRLRCVSRKEI